MSYSYTKNYELLQKLMQQVNIPDLEQLSQSSGVSGYQLLRLQNGLIAKMPIETLLKLAKALKISIEDLLRTFAPESIDDVSTPQQNQDRTEQRTAIDSLQQEYELLQTKMNKLEESAQQQFQQSSLQTLESWLLQWPTAVAAVEKNPLLPAERLIKLVKPVENLVKQWQVEAIAAVGEEVTYDPQLHQLMVGVAQPGDRVRVRYTGYRQGERLLYRAKVSPLAN